MKEGILSLIKAARFYRTFPILMVMLVVASFTGFVNTELIILGVSCVLIYSAASIHNALKDNDYSLPDYSNKIIIVLLSLGIILSFYDLVIFFTVIAWIALGYFYNTSSRFILLGDSTILAITHFALPAFSASLLLGYDNLSFIGYLFVIAWFFIPLKNLKDKREDKKRGYKTLATVTKKSKFFTILMFMISFMLIALTYLIFNLNQIFLIFLFIISVFWIIISINLFYEKNNKALFYSRLFIMLFLLGVIFSKTSKLILIIPGLVLVLLYLFVMFFNFRRKVK